MYTLLFQKSCNLCVKNMLEKFKVCAKNMLEKSEVARTEQKLDCQAWFLAQEIPVKRKFLLCVSAVLFANEYPGKKSTAFVKITLSASAHLIEMFRGYAVSDQPPKSKNKKK